MATLRIYKCDITPQKNCIVDAIETYLSGLEPQYESEDFQYQKIELIKSIKVNLPQAFHSLEIGNYAYFYQDNKFYYYFVTKANWTAKSTVELELTLDVLNTYRNDYVFEETKTQIVREHKDRFKDLTPILANETKYRSFIIDKADEGMSGLPKYRETNQVINDSNTQLNQKFYLVYSSIDDAEKSAVTCRLYPTNALRTGTQGTVTLKSSTLQLNKWYYIMYYQDQNTTSQIDVYFGSEHKGYLGNTFATGEIFYGFAAKRTSSTAMVVATIQKNETTKELSIQGSPYQETVRDIYLTGANISWRIDPNTLTGVRPTTDMREILSYEKVNVTVSNNSYCSTIDSVDRTDTRLIKIIECPYCPINITFNNGVMVLPASWSLQNGVITLTNLNAELVKDIGGNTEVNGTYVRLNQYIYTNNPTHSPKKYQLEPKLYHSDFSTLKFIYDSFNMELKRENLQNTPSTGGALYKLTYKQSNNITSNLAFRFETPYADGYKSESDYDGYMIATRNNESKIFTSQYLEYINYGIQYDRKAANRQIASQWIGTGVGIVATVLSLTVPGAGTVGAAAGISAGSTTINQIVSAISTSSTAHRNLEQKQAELARQASSVAGSDDLNLLNWYNGNKLRKMIYSIPDELKEKIFELFYHCGYASNRKGAPNTTSRYWFNYCQCEPTIRTEAGIFYDDIKREIEERWKIGVTVFHEHNGEYDWNQTYENFEIGMIG